MSYVLWSIVWIAAIFGWYIEIRFLLRCGLKWIRKKRGKNVGNKS